MVLHDLPCADDLAWLERLVDFCRSQFTMASPDDANAFAEGRLAPGERDRLLFTFDDGFVDSFRAAALLSRHGLRAIFFVVPSFLGRTVKEWLEAHRRNGVEAFRFASPATRGLTPSQVREMAAMGHRIGAHNDAHRDLGKLRDESALRDEIERPLEAIGELLGQPCEDFAWGFGAPEHLSTEAAEYLARRCPRVYSACGGLNVPGRSPRFFLRHDLKRWQGLRYVAMELSGGMDEGFEPAWAELERLGGRSRAGEEPALTGDPPAAPALPSSP